MEIKKRKRRQHIEQCYSCGKYFKINGKQDLYCDECRDREMKKSEKLVEKCDDTGVEQLALAVIRNAANDYLKDVKKWHNAYTNESKKREYYNIKKWTFWFKSKHFEFWRNAFPDLDGKVLQQKLNVMVYADIKNTIHKNKKNKRCKQ